MLDRLFLLLLAVLELTSASCGGAGSASESNVAGRWCGAPVATAADCVGDQVVYLDLQQTGTTVTGQSCLKYNTDCFDIQAANLTANHLTYFYTFGVDRVDAALTFDGGSNTLTGTYDSTKCSCQVPLVEHRVQ
jgi:hypothetical protein